MTKHAPGSFVSPASTLPLRSWDPAAANADSCASRNDRVCTKCSSDLRSLDPTAANPPDGNPAHSFSFNAPADATKPFSDFMAENPTVYHTIDFFGKKLSAAGYKELPVRESWSGKVKAGGKYYVTRNGSSMVAFSVGKTYKPGNGVAMIAAHADSLTAKLKPASSLPNAAGDVRLGVAPYGGSLNETWWDRDLGIGGRVVVKDESSGKTVVKVVKLDWPIAKIPTLAPHFGVGMLGSNNKETQLVPVIGLESSAGEDASPLGPEGSFIHAQPPKLVKMIAKKLGLSKETSILNWDLELFDCQPPQLVGLDKELLSAGRIDDKVCSWAAIMSLLDSNESFGKGIIKLVALFDQEEVGSLSRQGAKSNLLPLVIERAVESLGSDSQGPDIVARTYARSFLLSADVIHAGNPNFLERYLYQHVPKLNVGITISNDPNANMTTDAVSNAILRRVAEIGCLRTQIFQIRNDSRSGGTIGPSLSSMMGVRAADAGVPQMSMHSIRATTGALDPGLGLLYFRAFLDYWELIDGEWKH